jgi:uncharacterized protein YgiM (DUF1202 family)
MKRFYILVGILLLSSLACGQYVTTTPSPTLTTVSPSLVPAVLSPTRTPVPTETPQTVATNQAVIVKAVVNVRTSPCDKDGNNCGNVIGSLEAGDVVEVIECRDNWCQVKKPDGWVFQGCTDNNPNELKCEAK